MKIERYSDEWYEEKRQLPVEEDEDWTSCDICGEEIKVRHAIDCDVEGFEGLTVCHKCYLSL